MNSFVINNSSESRYNIMNHNLWEFKNEKNLYSGFVQETSTWPMIFRTGFWNFVTEMVSVFNQMEFFISVHILFIYCCAPARRGLQQIARAATRHGARDPLVKLGNYLDIKILKRNEPHIWFAFFTKTGWAWHVTIYTV